MTKSGQGVSLAATMKVKLLAAMLAALVLALGVWLFLDRGGRHDALVPSDAAVSPTRPAETVLEPIDAGFESEESALVSLAPERKRPVVEVSANESSWAEDLGGVFGRVVEEDGAPVAGISVAFLQVDANLLLGVDWQALGEAPQEIVLERTRTDDEGRFELSGAYDGSYQGLGIDLRGPRSTLRVVEQQVHGGERVDLGDIVLAAGCILTGRVVDETGTAVAGARVRVSPAPPAVASGLSEVQPFELQDLRSDCAVGISQYVHRGDVSPVVELPPLVRRHLDDFPLPTTLSDDEGRFRFEGVPIGGVLLAADMKGWLGYLKLFQAEAGENVLDDVTLRAGRTIHGEVFDLSGDPIVGAEVMAGTEIAGSAAVLHPAGPTDADGRFSVSGCPEDGNMMACARRRPGDPWIGVIGASVDDMEIEFEETFSITARLIDVMGAPVTGARVELELAFERGSPMGFAQRFLHLGEVRQPPRFRETEPGVYMASEVPSGRYEVSAWPEELSRAATVLEAESGSQEVILTCEPGRAIQLRVRDSSTGVPVAGARASVLSSQVDLFRALAVDRTDKEGQAELGPLQTRLFDWEKGVHEEIEWPLQVLVQHPRYADTILDVFAPSDLVDVSMYRGGEIQGQVTWGPDPPLKIYMLSLESREERSRGLKEAFLPPRIGRTGIDGSFRFSNLPEGTWRLQVFERFLHQDPLSIMANPVPPVLVHREDDFVIEPGIVRSITIDLTPGGAGQTAVIHGNIRLDGRPLEGAEVRVNAVGPTQRIETDANGDYETGPILCSRGPVQLRVYHDVDGKRTRLFEESLELIPGEVRRLDVDAGSTTILVRVVDRETQEPVAGAVVAILDEGSVSTDGTTDSVGEVSLSTAGVDKLRISAQASGYVRARRDVALDEAAAGVTQVLELTNPIPCAGICDLSMLDLTGATQVYLNVSGEGELNEWKQLDLEELVDGRIPFELNTIPSGGEYQARFWVSGNSGMSAQTSFELPGEGKTDLVLRYEPATSEPE